MEWSRNRLYVLALCDEAARARFLYVGLARDPVQRLEGHFDRWRPRSVQRLLEKEGLTGMRKCLWEVVATRETRALLFPGEAESLLTKALALHTGYPSRVYGADYCREQDNPRKWKSIAGDKQFCYDCGHPFVGRHCCPQQPTLLRDRAVRICEPPIRGLSLAGFLESDPRFEAVRALVLDVPRAAPALCDLPEEARNVVVLPPVDGAPEAPPPPVAEEPEQQPALAPPTAHHDLGGIAREAVEMVERGEAAALATAASDEHEAFRGVVPSEQGPPDPAREDTGEAKPSYPPSDGVVTREKKRTTCTNTAAAVPGLLGRSDRDATWYSQLLAVVHLPAYVKALRRGPVYRVGIPQRRILARLCSGIPAHLLAQHRRRREKDARGRRDRQRKGIIRTRLSGHEKSARQRLVASGFLARAVKQAVARPQKRQVAALVQAYDLYVRAVRS